MMLLKKNCLAVAVLVFLTVSYAPRAIAQFNINTDVVGESVVFLYSADDAGNVDKKKPIGTAFLVEVPLLSNPSKSYKLLVTARHIVDPQWACSGVNPTKMFASLNKKNFDPAKDQAGTAELPMLINQPDNPGWVGSKDDQVDAAVMVVVDPKIATEYDVAAARISDFPTDEELKRFKTGDAIVSAGLLEGATTGKKRNYPIFKFGNVSSIPDEPIEVPCKSAGAAPVDVKVWLIAASLVPGNSGSPIFFSPPYFTGPNSNTRAMLLGIQSTSFLGSDVAGMTPVQYLYKIIEDLNLSDADLRRGPLPAVPAQAKPGDIK